MKDYVGSGDCEFCLRKAALIAAPWQKLSAICQTSLPRFSLNFCPWDVLGTWWRGLRCPPCPCWRVRWWYASSVVRLSGVKPLDIRHHADVQGKSVCQNPNIEWMQNNKKHSQPLTVLHLDVPRLLICQGTDNLENLSVHRKSWETASPSKLFSHILHGLSCNQPSEMHSNTWDFGLW